MVRPHVMVQRAHYEYAEASFLAIQHSFHGPGFAPFRGTQQSPNFDKDSQAH